MKKNIIIAVLTVTSILSIVYGRYQKTEAVKQEALAMENARLAREASIMAEKHMKEAEMHRLISERQAAIALEALKKEKGIK